MTHEPVWNFLLDRHFLFRTRMNKDKQRDDWEGELEQFTMAVYVIRKEGGEHHEPPADIGVVIEGVKVLNELPSFTSACALLLGMIYIINLAYPKPLRFTFEVLDDGQRDEGCVVVDLSFPALL
ncbi:hypothetical protein F2P79_013887 [Pimephales promelas]|nr:hypothetical protein F2P79_013887 [Pimephales promelas]